MLATREVSLPIRTVSSHLGPVGCLPVERFPSCRGPEGWGLGPRGCATGTFHHRRFSCADDMSILSIFCWPVTTNARDFGL